AITDETGQAVTDLSQLQYTSSNPGVVGLTLYNGQLAVTGLTAGSATVILSYQGATAEFDVTVTGVQVSDGGGTSAGDNTGGTTAPTPPAAPTAPTGDTTQTGTQQYLPAGFVGVAYYHLSLLGGTVDNAANMGDTVVQGSLPAGMNWDPMTDTFSGTPQAAGNYSFTLTNTTTGTAWTYHYDVSDLPEAVAGQEYNFQMPPGGWVLLSTNGQDFPFSLNYDQATHTDTLSGTPSQAGSYTVTMYDYAYFGTSSLVQPVTFTINVLPAGSQAPAVQTVAWSDTGSASQWSVPSSQGDLSLPQATLNQPYDLNLYQVPQLQTAWAVVGGQLPPGLSFDAYTYKLTGTPAQAGTYQFKLINVQAGTVYAGQVYDVTLTVNQPGTTASDVQTVALPDATVGVAYNPTLPFVGHYELVSGTLPPGLTFSANVLRGTPTAAGSYVFTVYDSDSGQSVVYTVNVADAGTAGDTSSGGGSSTDTADTTTTDQGGGTTDTEDTSGSTDSGNTNTSGSGTSTGSSGNGSVSYGTMASPSVVNIFGSVDSQPFQGLQMPAGYPASGGLQMPEGYAASTGQASQQVAGTETQGSYTVKKGDTLWNIAKKYYGDGRQWRKILEANPNCLSRPGDTRTLKVGFVLNIPA
ncbi:MAG TPA: putative Ig domain-containing protein, partial [Patescibacteria group bacterium]|nr:putative Ig domain-containing protein [Patescibacteria group bacterium]